MAIKNNDNKSDFFVDLPMVFSVVKADELVASANEFYGTNIILPKAGGRFDVRSTQGVVHKFYLYKLTMRKLDSEERQFKNNVSGFETTMEKMGVFSNLYEVMTFADTITIFSNLNEADIFLRAVLRANDDNTKSVFLCADSEIEGLEHL
ncbi:hypothetical protein CQA66_02660 [Helicobacter aurati]|uniref:Uncharacterized protein n=1 Tax=Helicobacter aurati TaxID=137778 RepID=A0A3D8J6N4_9HELI|nr:hypothetical protein [Helicobacter aurati]RDU73143.1 hypothetical protein CQA66_02660 [Helicobacter aurati]